MLIYFVCFLVKVFYVFDCDLFCVIEYFELFVFICCVVSCLNCWLYCLVIGWFGILDFLVVCLVVNLFNSVAFFGDFCFWFAIALFLFSFAGLLDCAGFRGVFCWGRLNCLGLWDCCLLCVWVVDLLLAIDCVFVDCWVGDGCVITVA